MILPWRWVSLNGGPPLFSSVTEAETTRLQELATAAGDALEIGSAYGYASIAMALAGAHVITVDPHAGELPSSLEVMNANLIAYDIDGRVTPLIGSSQQTLPDLERGSFGLVFIDGDHTEATVDHDVTWALKLLRVGGTLACHDYGEDSCPGVKAALDRLLGPPSELVDTLYVHRP